MQPSQRNVIHALVALLLDLSQTPQPLHSHPCGLELVPNDAVLCKWGLLHTAPYCRLLLQVAIFQHPDKGADEWKHSETVQ